MSAPALPAGRTPMADAPGDAPPDGGGVDAAETGADAGEASDGDAAGGHPFVFLAGLLLFLVSAAAYLADLATGHDVLRSLALNGLGTLVLVTWAAHDTLVDPNANVSSVPGAAGTALLLLGLYLLVAVVALVLSSPWHARLGLVPYLGGAAVVLAVVGFAVFPVEALLADDEGTP